MKATFQLSAKAVICNISLFVLLELLTQCNHFEDKQPNIVLILADDQAWGDVSFNGNKNISTPNIDQLCEEGATINYFYVSPVCAPTRASILTGRHYTKTGVSGVDRGNEYMNLDETTIAELLKAGGYKTGIFGKWHNGAVYPYHPNARGFDEFYGFCNGVASNYFNTTLEHNGNEVKTEGYIADWLTTKAIDFIKINQKYPFFCYIPFNTPHEPLQVPDSFYNRVKERGITMFYRDKDKEINTGIEHTIASLAMCENIDMNVGRILNVLKEYKLENNTIVIYMSDNGPNTFRWNGSMKGKKGQVSEGGIRVPFVIKYPGKIKPKTTIDQIAADIDLLPTLTSYAGVSTEKCKPLDGKNLRPLLEDENINWPDRMIFSASLNKNTSVRSQTYRLENNELYNIINDPGQQNNIDGDEPDIFRQLDKALKTWTREINNNIENKIIYPVGFPEWPVTKLYVQDCKFHGKGLQFSNYWPNLAWMMGWTDINDYPYWNVEIVTEGRYLVSIYYTCPETDIGSEFELTFNDKSLKGMISEAYDPDLIYSPDRVQRQGSYEKPFKELIVGIIYLPSKTGQLKLKAISMPGKQIMELNAVKLTLLK